VIQKKKISQILSNFEKDKIEFEVKVNEYPIELNSEILNWIDDTSNVSTIGTVSRIRKNDYELTHIGFETLEAAVLFKARWAGY
jgi:hypothetical protein